MGAFTTFMEVESTGSPWTKAAPARQIGPVSIAGALAVRSRVAVAGGVKHTTMLTVVLTREGTL
jgi:hypothetical protein